MTPRTVGPDRARRIALAAQGFADPRPVGTPTRRHLDRVLRRTRLVQMDSVTVLTRAHYLPLFSRLGAYPRALLDDAAFGPPRGRTLVEYWAHEASLVPLATWPLLRWRMQDAADHAWGRVRRLAQDRPGYVDQVLATVAERGPVRAGEVEARTERAGPWWDWHDAKTALEWLFWSGRVTAARRTAGFERVYDLVERVLPADVLDQHPERAVAQRQLLRQAASALGIATEADLRDYWRMPVVDTRAGIAALVEAGELEPVTVPGWGRTAYLAPDARAPRALPGATVLAPFDPLVWERSRAERLFGFRYRIEIYVPAPRRVHGYYVLPVLVDGDLVGRVDLKADRARGVLQVLAAYAEPGRDPVHVAAALAPVLHELAGWLGLQQLAGGERGDLMPTLAARL